MRSLSCVVLLLAILLLRSENGATANELAPISTDAQVTLAVDWELAAEIAGRVLEVTVREGDVVQSGQVLLRLDARRAEQDVARAHQELQMAQLQRENDVDRRYAEKTLDVQLQELERSLSANEQFANSVSRTELRRLELLVEQARLSIEKSERDQLVAAAQEALKAAELRLAELQLTMHQIVSPGAGVVAAVHRQAGESANAGEPLIRVILLDRLRIEAFLPGELATDRLVGQPVTFRSSMPESTAVGPTAHDGSDSIGLARGTILFVSSEIHPVTGQCRVWAEVPNHDRRLRPGMRGTLLIGDRQE